MVTFTIIQMMVMMFFSFCRAQDGCVAYDSANSFDQQFAVGSHYECFEASVSRKQSHAYTYKNGICTVTALLDPINISVNPKLTTGFVICADDPSNCTAYRSYKPEGTSFSSTHAECVGNCSINAKCIGYTYNTGSCMINKLEGNPIDFNSTTSTDAFIRCGKLEPETTTQEATTQATTTQATTTHKTTTPTTTASPTTKKTKTTTTTQETTTQEATTPPATTTKVTKKRCIKG